MPYGDALSSRSIRRGGALRLAVGAAVVLGAGGAIAWYATSGEETEDTATLDVAAAEVMTFSISTTSTGELEARRQVEVRNPLDRNGTIVEIIAEGTRVNPGDVLIRFSTEEIEREIEEEMLRVSEAESQLLAAESTYRIQIGDNENAKRNKELALELARLAFDQWESGDDPKQQTKLRVAVENTMRDLERRRETYARSTELVEKGFLSRDQFQLDGINLAKAEADLRIAELELDTYMNYQRPRDMKQKQSDVDNAVEDLERTLEQNEINLNRRNAEQLDRRRRLTLRQERLDDYRRQLEAAVVTAPADGLVVYSTSLEQNRWNNEGPLQVGRQLRPNQLAVVLPETTEMLASVRVHESLAGRIRPGQSAVIRADAATETPITGRVESIGVLAEGGGWRDPNRREYTVKIALEDVPESLELKPSMRCEADITLGTVEDALAIPVQAVFTDGRQRFIYRPAGSKFERVPVDIGRRSSVFAEIASGLEVGTQVLLREPAPGEIIDRSDDEPSDETPQRPAIAGAG
ncbi:MAG: efflux RND transporter periplasmic adaptor subunit [Planctomycetota bacterium]